MTGEIEIKPCPFCGTEAGVEEYEFGDSPESSYRVSCRSGDGHSLDYWDDSHKEAVDTWNQRA